MSEVDPECLRVTLGWDLCPTIEMPGGYVYSRKVENILHRDYYPRGYKGEWPIDPLTGEKLPMDKRGLELLGRECDG